MKGSAPEHAADRSELRQCYSDLLLSEAPATGAEVARFSKRLLTCGFPVAEFDALHADLTSRGAMAPGQRRNAHAIKDRVLAGYDRALSLWRSGELSSQTVDVEGRRGMGRREQYLAEDAMETMVSRSLLDEKTAEIARLGDLVLAQREELSGLIYAISHDLKAPSSMVASLLGQFLEHHADADLETHDIEDALATSFRMRTILDDLLEFSGTFDGSPHTEAVDLNKVVAALVDSLSARSAGRFEIRWDRLPTVPGSEAQLRMLFRNLIANAVLFRHPDRVPQVEIRHEGPRGQTQVAISVVDNGIGIDPAYHDRIFGLFRRLHTYADYPGSGIGLALCKRVARSHQAELSVRSKPGEGSSFTVVLPL